MNDPLEPTGRAARHDLFLVRHGETVWNREKRFQGLRDSPLTATGRDQASAAGDCLARLLHDRPGLPLICSPLPRALATASIIRGRWPGPPPIADAALREVALGDWEGRTRSEVKAAWAARLAAVPKPQWYFEAPDGEAYDAARRRAEAFLRDLAGPAVVVTHSIFGRLLRGVHEGLEREATVALPAPHDAVWHLAPDGSVRLVSTASMAADGASALRS
ncbi:histidine phosphatase family protein [Zavarzinia compransoris]|uniref:histidine phosphatase family protein n=1 Tax=Zavarzinia marina TaxID=2911065 RepID=UPI001F1E1415|nr:histidine phosphatase family protein [Zavarzinia marina]MCF4167330.1 histidine phosphatase family protein [Zavarzinia marina]